MFYDLLYHGITYIKFGLAHWMRIRTEVKSWIRICIETNADPQHWLMLFKFLLVNGTGGTPIPGMIPTVHTYYFAVYCVCLLDGGNV